MRAMIYNLTNVSGAHTPFALVKAVNDLTGQMWATMLLLVAFFVFFVSFKNYPAKTSFGTAAFITAVLAVFFRIIGLIPDFVLVMASVLAAVGFLLIWFGD